MLASEEGDEVGERGGGLLSVRAKFGGEGGEGGSWEEVDAALQQKGDPKPVSAHSSIMEHYIYIYI